jgi:hypothetical protein
MDRMSTFIMKIEPKEQKHPYLARQMSKWFMTLPPELLQEHPMEVH